MKKFAREETTGIVLHEEMVDGSATTHGAKGLAAHYARTDGVRSVGLNFFHFGKMDAVFVAEGQVAEQILERVDSALGQQLRALRANAFDHAHFGVEAHHHT